MVKCKSIFQSGLNPNQHKVLVWLHKNTGPGAWIAVDSVTEACGIPYMQKTLTVLQENRMICRREIGDIDSVCITSKGRRAI